MNDPYKVLDISPSATDDEVKTAYRELAKKYHPDNYAASPLADLAKEKMQEINEAYDTVMNIRRGKTSGNAGNPGGAYGGSPYGGASYGGSQQFGDIRRLIQSRRLAEAEELLDGIPQQSRDAEWHFLKGSVFYARGWLNEAYTHFNTACSLNPDNPEYRAALRQLNWQRQGNMYGGNPGGYRTQPTTAGCSSCDMCSGLICADCCCECMGGDLISCC